MRYYFSSASQISKFLDKMNQVNLLKKLPSLENLNRLNELSKKINSLEADLKKLAIPFQFVYLLWSEESNVGDSKIKRDHCLVLARNDKNQLRLLYQVFEIECEFSDLECNESLPDLNLSLKFVRPLIETKGHLRLQIESELTYFVDLLLDSLKNDFSKKIVVVHSPRSVQYKERLSLFASYLEINEGFCPFCSTENTLIFCPNCQK